MRINLPSFFWPFYYRWPCLPMALKFKWFGVNIYLELYR